MQDFAAYTAGFAQGQADKRNQVSSMTPLQYEDNPDYAAGYAAGEAASVEPTYTPPPTNFPPPPPQTSMNPISPGDWERARQYGEDRNELNDELGRTSPEDIEKGMRPIEPPVEAD
jgi:hypothetical protein